MKTKVVILSLLFILFLSISAEAQCAMCRAVLESEEDQSAAQGINDGIVYLMAIPYVLVAGIGYIVYWKFFRTKTEA
ncbi:hypothetical protein [uncultured Winogradskyella sp.]|uniref:hypothetical protein n=1 Tax=uncultured Winogradskyella sp. TaxID=395353 RepID=UPI002620A970|nr:hypothetical protein [uncultured Winogradskyella sp.]